MSVTGYRLCGLRLASEMPFAELMEDPQGLSAPDVTLTVGAVPEGLDAPDHRFPLHQTRGRDLYLLHMEGVARYLVEGGRRIRVQPLMAADAPEIRLFLFGTVLGALCHQRGLLPIHAGVVETAAGAVGFMGVSAAGKSTLVAHLVAAGYPLVSDDLCVVDAAARTVAPSFPRLKLWQDSLQSLGLAGGERVCGGGMDKFYLAPRGAFARGVLPLAALIRLEEERGGGGYDLRRETGMAAFQVVQANVYRKRIAEHLGRQGEMFSAVGRVAAGVAVYTLTRPWDLARLGEGLDLLRRRGFERA